MEVLYCLGVIGGAANPASIGTVDGRSRRVANTLHETGEAVTMLDLPHQENANRVVVHAHDFCFIVALHPNARVLMTRDMELIRKILLSIQARTDTEPRTVNIEGVDSVTLVRHVEMLLGQGLIEGRSFRTTEANRIDVTDLSWAGHDFIGVLENSGVWDKIKQSFSVAELAGMPLSVLKDVGVGLLKEWAKKKVGLTGSGGSQIDV